MQFLGVNDHVSYRIWQKTLAKTITKQVNANTTDFLVRMLRNHGEREAVGAEALPYPPSALG